MTSFESGGDDFFLFRVLAGTGRRYHSRRSVTSFPFGEGHAVFLRYAPKSERPSPGRVLVNECCW
jgi:hypothetical protein